MQKTELKFNSQVCTTEIQSHRLLDLGLKPETADCMWCAVTKDAKGKEIPSKKIKWYLQAHTSTSKQIVGFMEYTHIPAWSLHRLIDLLHVNHVEFVWKDGCYEQAIQMIKKRIEDGFIPKEYLNK